MDTMTFITELVKALAWPITALALVAAAWKPMKQLVPFLQKLRYGGLEFEFRRRVEEAEAAATAGPMAQHGPQQPHVIPDHYLRLAEVSPRAVVVEAWREVETAAQDAARRAGIQMTPSEAKSPLQMIQALALSEVVDNSTRSVMHELRQLRNDAIHAPEFALGRDAVLNYADVARKIAQKLRDTRPLA